jgi:hypothetical protein
MGYSRLKQKISPLRLPTKTRPEREFHHLLTAMRPAAEISPKKDSYHDFSFSAIQ